MITSEALYSQVRWDPRFDPTRWVLGVEVRLPEPKRVALVDFVPRGDIPWHRVVYFEADGERVWDRRTGIDRAEASGLGRVRDAAVLSAAHFAPRVALAWQGGAWRPEGSPEPALQDAHTVLTWNVLFDRYDSGELHSPTRRGLLLDALQELDDVDVIAMQEVQSTVLRPLMATAWMRAGWRVVLPGTPKEVDQFGLVLLARVPVRETGFLQFSGRKGALAMVVDGLSGPRVLVTTHLTSDHTEGAGARRDQQLLQLREALDASGGASVVLGDLNVAGPVPNVALGLRDVGVSAPTFDPARNPLAAICSQTGEALCIDRVLVSPQLRGTGAARLGMQPQRVDVDGLDALHISDHFGVRVTVGPCAVVEGPVLDGPVTARTALCWIPENVDLDDIDGVRARLDPAVVRWMPHVNLVFGFVPEHRFEQAAAVVQSALEDVPPFETEIEGQGTFSGRRERTVWLDPDAGGHGRWQAIAGRLDPVFPGCARAHTFTPHLTIARVSSRQSVPTVPKLDAQVERLALVSRRGDGPMVVRGTVPLGGGPVVWHDGKGPETVPWDRPARVQEADGVWQALRAALPECGVWRTGSRAIDCALVVSDLDVVVAAPPGVDVARRLGAAVPGGDLRRVSGARVPGLKLSVAGLSVDIAVVDIAVVDTLGVDGVAPVDAVAQRAHLPVPAAHALSAVSDAEALRAAVGEGAPRFRRLLGVVRTWARSRGLDVRPLGGLPGLAWSVLAARVVLDAPTDMGDSALVVSFFETWAERGFGLPVSLHDDWAGQPGLPVQICTPSAPLRACSDGVTQTMATLLAHELLRAWAVCVEGGSLAELCAPPPMHRRHGAWAVVGAPSVGPAGRVRGRLRALLGMLEAAGVEGVHVWPHAHVLDGKICLAVGLGPTPPDASALARMVSPWLARVADVGGTVDWVAGGGLDLPSPWPVR